TAMKRLSTHKGRGLPRNTQGEEHLALQGALADGVIAVVCTKHRGIGPHGNTMGARKHPFTPGAQEMPLAVENHHRMRSTVKGIDIVLCINPNCGDFPKRPALRELRPGFYDFVSIMSYPQCDHRAYSVMFVFRISSYRLTQFQLRAYLLSNSSVAGAGTGKSPCAACTEPYPVLMGEVSTR